MSEIYKIIDKQKLEVVKKPISKAHGLPNECYTNKEYTLIERKKLFEDKWTVIGTASSLPKTGDVKPFDLLGLPLLIVRNKKNNFRFHHISTDEVFGTLDSENEEKFNEKSSYSPRSPYSASKASSDHLVQSWNATYGLPTLITNPPIKLGSCL